MMTHHRGTVHTGEDRELDSHIEDASGNLLPNSQADLNVLARR